MADELDLERGIPEAGESRRRRKSSGSSEEKPSVALDNELHKRLVSAFDQVVEWRAAREDRELAEAIDEDKEKMTRGLVSLTHVLAPLRQPLLIFLAFVEPVLAFGRVGRILTGRFIERRQRIMAERAAMMEEMAPEPVQTWEPGAVVNPPA